MASTVVPVPETAPRAKVSFVSLLLVCIVAGLAAVGGSAAVLVYLSRHGKLGAASAPMIVQAAPRAETTENAPTHNVVLEPMLVNLADADGHSYLRLGVVLAESVEKGGAGKEEGKPAPGADAAVRDSVLGVLAHKHAAELLDAQGKDALKKELKAALGVDVPKAHVQAVYFTEFLVQR